MVNTKERSNKSATLTENQQLKSSTPTTSSKNTVVTTSSSSPSSSSSSSSISVSAASPSSSAIRKNNGATSAIGAAADANCQAVAPAIAHAKLIPITSVLNTEPSGTKQPNQHLTLHNTNLAAAPYLQPQSAIKDIFNGGIGSLQPTELPQEDEERLAKLFKRLDRDGNGKIDIHDLSDALREFGLSSAYAEKFLEHTDKNHSGDIGLAEFVFYVREHEKNLRLQFSHLDKNKDGKVDLEELISAFKDLGIEVDTEEAKKLLLRMDKDGSLNISFNEWRDFLLMAPSTDIHDLIRFWRHSTYLDIGEDLNVPDDFTQSEMLSGMWWRHLAAGGMAGAVSRTCTAPLDRIKVYLQVSKQKVKITDSLRYMLEEGGKRSLWRGNGVNVLKIAPETAIKFAVYEKLKRMIRGEEKRQMTIGERFVAGALAGGFSQTIIYPMEVLKTRLALRKTGQYTGIMDAAQKIYRTEGIRSFYRGYIPNMLGIVPYAGIDLAIYETLKRKYLSTYNAEQPSFLVLLACGTVSSTMGQVFSYPLALVRTRLQAQVGVMKPVTAINRVQKLVISEPRGVGIPMKETVGQYNEETMVGIFKRILKTEGFTGLYRGMTPNFIKVLPAVWISYTVYEYTSRALGVNMT